MSVPFAPLPLRLAHAWVTLYTRGLPAARRDARRAELTSDLWEHCHDDARGGAGGPTVNVLGRVMAGVPADLAWRVEERGWARADAAPPTPWYQHPFVIPAVAVVTAIVAFVGLPGSAATLLAGLMLLALVGLARGLVWGPAVNSPGKDLSVELSASRRRTTLLVVLAVSAIVMAATYAYAMSLETWGDTRAIVFVVVGWSSLAVSAGALILLILDFVRTRRR